MDNKNHTVIVTTNKQPGSSAEPTEMTIKLSSRQDIDDLRMLIAVGIGELDRRRRSAQAEIEPGTVKRLANELLDQMREAFRITPDVKVGDLLGRVVSGEEEWCKVTEVYKDTYEELFVATTTSHIAHPLSRYTMHVVPSEFSSQV